MLLYSFGHWFQLDFTLSYAHMIYFTIIPRVRVGSVCAKRQVGYNDLIQATSASGINVLLNTPTKYREFFPTLFVKTTDF